MLTKAPLTIRVQLNCLVVLSVLPFWLVSGFLVYQAYSAKHDQVSASMLNTARLSATVVDKELTNIQAGLQGLGTSPAFAAGDFKTVHRQILLLLKSYPSAHIIVADATGQQLVNSFRPFGTPLPKRKTPETVRRIFEKGRPVVSDLFYGALTSRPLIGIDIPVIIDGKVKYDLGMTFPADYLSNVLLMQKLPKNRYSSILDSNQVVVARSRNLQQYLGERVNSRLRQAVTAASEGTIEASNLEGNRVFVSFCRSVTSGWTVSVGVPEASIMEDVYQWMWWSILGVAFISLAGIALAGSLASRIAYAIRSLVSPALSLGRGELVVVNDSNAVKETAEVAAALAQASKLIQTRHAELQESERRYSALFANKVSAIAHCKIITDEKGLPVDYRIIQINEAYERIIGVKKAEIEGRTVREVFPGVENYSFDYINMLGCIALEGGEASYESFLEPTQQYLSIYCYSPSPGEFTTIFTDITERRRADEALRRSERALTEAQRVAHIGSWHWDATADTVWWSDELYRIYEKTPGSLLPSYEEDQKNYSPESAARLTSVVQKAMQTGEPYLIDLERSVSTSPRRWVQARGEALRNAAGLVEGLRGTVQDITDRKEAEESLKMYAQRIIALEEDLRKRISRELHDDVGQELTALGLNLAHLARNLPDQSREKLQTVMDDSRLLTKDISRSVRNLMAELRPSQLDEYGLASAIRCYVDQFSQRTGLAAVAQVVAQFPRLDSNTEVALFRITQEALSNVSKHAMATKVSISLTGDGASVRLTITDDGKGFQHQETLTNPTGSGWGLTIMRERAELAGGRFRLTSATDEGTSIIVEISEGF